MKRSLNILFIAVLAIGANIAAALASPSDDEAAILAVVNEYIVGWREGDAERLSAVMEMDNGYVIWRTGETGDDPINSRTWRKVLENRRENPGYGEPYEVVDLNIIQDDLANVIVEISWPGRTTYIDNLVLYKQGEDWKIILKSFTAKDEEVD